MPTGSRSSLNTDDWPGVRPNRLVTERLVPATVTLRQEASLGAWVSDSSTAPVSWLVSGELVHCKSPAVSAATVQVKVRVRVIGILRWLSRETCTSAAGNAPVTSWIQLGNTAQSPHRRHANVIQPTNAAASLRGDGFRARARDRAGDRRGLRAGAATEPGRRPRGGGALRGARVRRVSRRRGGRARAGGGGARA